MYLDYNNSYSLKKAVTTLRGEFERAISQKNMYYARSVIQAARQLEEKLSLTYRESEDLGETMSYFQKVFVKQLRGLIGEMARRTQSGMGVTSYE